MGNSNGLGEMVVFKVSEKDVEAINRRRGHFAWSKGHGIAGFVAHIGNDVKAGQQFPMLVVKVWGPDIEVACVNGQVFLDGNDVFWATSVQHGFDAHQFTFPGEVAPMVASPASQPVQAGGVTFVAPVPLTAALVVASSNAELVVQQGATETVEPANGSILTTPDPLAPVVAPLPTVTGDEAIAAAVAGAGTAAA